MSCTFEGKVAIVTGASRGIGRAIAERFGVGGARLVVTARSEDSLADTANGIRGSGGKVITVATPDGNADRVVAAAVSEFGQVDILVNNAGTTKSGAFLTLTDDDWADGYATKLFAAMRLCRAAWPELRKVNGTVINIAGAGGRTPDAFFTIGGSVNAAVMAFTKSLAQLGIEEGVQVNAVNPGLIKTDRLTRRIAEAAERWELPVDEAESRLLAEHKIARFGRPSEIAELIAYIASPAGRLLQGALIDADAGFTKGV
jgi:NAD(P)-dependent dehydrogenase (short-subunit alcohol dehydrogenase family)